MSVKYGSVFSEFQDWYISYICYVLVYNCDLIIIVKFAIFTILPKQKWGRAKDYFTNANNFHYYCLLLPYSSTNWDSVNSIIFFNLIQIKTDEFWGESMVKWVHFFQPSKKGLATKCDNRISVATRLITTSDIKVIYWFNASWSHNLRHCSTAIWRLKLAFRNNDFLLHIYSFGVLYKISIYQKVSGEIFWHQEELMHLFIQCLFYLDETLANCYKDFCFSFALLRTKVMKMVHEIKIG